MRSEDEALVAHPLLARAHHASRDGLVAARVELAIAGGAVGRPARRDEPANSLPCMKYWNASCASSKGKIRSMTGRSQAADDRPVFGGHWRPRLGCRMRCSSASARRSSEDVGGRGGSRPPPDGRLRRTSQAGWPRPAVAPRIRFDGVIQTRKPSTAKVASTHATSTASNRSNLFMAARFAVCYDVTFGTRAVLTPRAADEPAPPRASTDRPAPPTGSPGSPRARAARAA